MDYHQLALYAACIAWGLVVFLTILEMILGIRQKHLRKKSDALSYHSKQLTNQLKRYETARDAALLAADVVKLDRKIRRILWIEMLLLIVASIASVYYYFF